MLTGIARIVGLMLVQVAVKLVAVPVYLIALRNVEVRTFWYSFAGHQYASASKRLAYLPKWAFWFDNWYNGANGDTPWYRENPNGGVRKYWTRFRWYMRNTARNLYDFKFGYMGSRNNTYHQYTAKDFEDVESFGGFHASIVNEKYPLFFVHIPRVFYFRIGWCNWRSQDIAPVAFTPVLIFPWFKNPNRSRDAS